MGLTTAMYTGLTGMHVNQERINTIGNNIANVNTTAFKGSRTLFQTQFSQLISAGNAPSDTGGGVNPTQVGFGALVGTTQKNMTPGSIETTGVASDLAIQGDGFFVVQRPNGQQAYTRDGAFSLDAQNRMVTIDGNAVLGYGVDENFGIVPNALQELVLPIGTLSIARPTQNVVMDGDLSASGSIATQGSTHTSQAMVNGGGGAADGSTALTDLRSASDPTTPLFAAGSVLSVSGVDKGGRSLPPATFVVGTDGNSLGDLAAWMQTQLGIQTGVGGGTPGVTVEGGALVVRSNAGEPNGFTFSAGDITSDNVAAALPFSFSETAAADGSGVFTSYTVYDSLGTPVQVNVTMVLEQTTATGPIWRFYAEAPDASGAIEQLGTGTVEFDTNGNFRAVTGNELQIDRADTGAASPLAFAMDFSGVHGLSTRASALIASDQDGFPPGTLSSYGVGADGTVTGIFSNGLTRTLGQVALAVFPNAEGLVADADNLYLQGPNSGTPTVSAPGQFAAGQIQSGALELSNVDLSREFIGLITSSTGFQAASRVISTTSELLDQLLLITR